MSRLIHTHANNSTNEKYGTALFMKLTNLIALTAADLLDKRYTNCDLIIQMCLRVSA